MPLVVADRVQETSSTSGLFDFTLDGATAGYQSFNAGVGTSNTTYYCAYSSDLTLNQWEVGIATLASSTLLQRTTVLDSSSGGAKVNFSAGIKVVFCTYPAERAVYKDAANVPPYETDNEAVAIAIVMG
jgi:membrane-bound inhibitor of C-type lysozyme